MKTILSFFIGIMTLLLCNIFQGHSMIIPSDDRVYQAVNDTTVYDMPDITAELPDAINYFLTNNKHKDWKETDRKMVVLQGIVEKDGTITGVRVLRSSQVDDLDKEAVRLINVATYKPAKNRNQVVRSKLTIVVQFPPQKQ